jgi:hypothetical protein
VRERAPGSSVLVYPKALSAVTELRQRRIDLMVHDAPVGIWFVSTDEANLAALLKLLNEENLGWGMRRTTRRSGARSTRYWRAGGRTARATGSSLAGSRTGSGWSNRRAVRERIAAVAC